MTVDEFRAALERAEGKPDTALLVTGIGRIRGGTALGMRPRVLERRANGDRVYAFTVGQVRRMLKRVDEIEARP